MGLFVYVVSVVVLCWSYGWLLVLLVFCVNGDIVVVEDVLVVVFE